MTSLWFLKQNKTKQPLLFSQSFKSPFNFSNVPVLIFSISDDVASLILHLCSVDSCFHFLMGSDFLIFLLTSLQKFFESKEKKNGLFQKEVLRLFLSGTGEDSLPGTTPPQLEVCKLRLQPV